MIASKGGNASKIIGIIATDIGKFVNSLFPDIMISLYP